MAAPKVRRWIKIAVPIVVLLAVVVLGSAIYWGLTPLGPSPYALSALRSSDTVRVAQTKVGWEFMPREIRPTVGVIFYPGGHVDARSYAPYAADLAAEDYLVVIVPMPLSLAVLAPNSADAVIDAYPAMTDWVIAGHSLGGTMAARYADAHLDQIEGLVLLASYPAERTDLSQAAVTAASVLGTRDTVIDQATWSAAKPLLPDSTRYIELDGGNHAQFGSYGPQKGDSPATITAEQQRASAVSATVGVLERVVTR
jgi:hypothetical protein